MAATACTGGTASSTEPLVSTTGSEEAVPAISEIEVVSWIESFGEDLTECHLDAASDVWAEKWSSIAVPLSHGNAAITPPAPMTDAVSFPDSWTDLELLIVSQETSSTSSSRCCVYGDGR